MAKPTKVEVERTSPTKEDSKDGEEVKKKRNTCRVPEEEERRKKSCSPTKLDLPDVIIGVLDEETIALHKQLEEASKVSLPDSNEKNDVERQLKLCHNI